MEATLAAECVFTLPKIRQSRDFNFFFTFMKNVDSHWHDGVGSHVCGVSAACAPSKYDGGATAAQHHHGDIWVAHNRKRESLC